MNKLYVVQDWLPFPSSEYGGIRVIVAETDEEVVQLILATVREWDAEQYPNHTKLIREVVSTADVMDLSELTDRIGAITVAEFYT